ncbi:GntR family transcriptional regulator [Sphingobacterium corticis]|uniref:GntR family transcriptional regulator n=1 Tax=Sphingobacterium corticis TaxID=1812823 RepID=A0ABW5NJD5_9SPHI
MEFSNEKPIYLQIVEFAMNRIILSEWKNEQKIPSVRDLAVSLEVNANTVMRAYDHLQQQEIIFNKRGLGFFVHQDARTTILKAKKIQFLEEELPLMFRTLDLLDISIDEVNTYYNNQQKS